MDVTAIGAEIRSQRERLGLSLERAAELARLGADRIARIEAGELITVHELWALGDALAFDPSTVLRGESREDPRRTAARFRSPSGIRELEAEDARFLARAAELGRVGASLRRQLGLSPGSVVEHRRVLAVDSARENWREGYDLGEAARERLAPARAPIRSVQALLEEGGVHVATIGLRSSEVLAAAIYEHDAMPVVLLNAHASRAKHPLSRRAILAHELCHLLHDGGTHDVLTWVSRQENREPHEQRANGFAPAFLAPRAWVRAEARSARECVRAIGEQWGFSFEGAAWHAKSCGFISAEEAESLVREGYTIDAGDWESGPQRDLPKVLELSTPVSPLVVGLVQELAVRALQEGSVSAGRASEILRFS